PEEPIVGRRHTELEEAEPVVVRVSSLEEDLRQCHVDDMNAQLVQSLQLEDAAPESRPVSPVVVVEEPPVDPWAQFYDEQLDEELWRCPYTSCSQKRGAHDLAGMKVHLCLFHHRMPKMFSPPYRFSFDDLRPATPREINYYYYLWQLRRAAR